MLPQGHPLHSSVWLQGVTAHPDLPQPALRGSVPSCHTGVVAVSWGHLSGTPELLLDKFLWITAHLLLSTAQHSSTASCTALPLPHGLL